MCFIILFSNFETYILTISIGVCARWSNVQRATISLLLCIQNKSASVLPQYNNKYA